MWTYKQGKQDDEQPSGWLHGSYNFVFLECSLFSIRTFTVVQNVLWKNFSCFGFLFLAY